MNGLCVAKFGGSSVANLEAMQACVNILAHNQNARVAVLSASMGVTNLLVELASGLAEEQLLAKLNQVQVIQNNILNSLPTNSEINLMQLKNDISELLAKIEHLSNQAKNYTSLSLTDELISLGEMMSSKIFVYLLNSQGIKSKWVDVREIIVTDSQFGKAKPISTFTQSNAKKILYPLLSQGYVVVTQGFIGRDRKGRTTTLGRGGSDYSAALLAEVLQSQAVHIWTDVAGIYTTDPRLIPNAKPIPNLTFTEAGEMANFGAKVLHPSTLLPAVRSNIPVYVGNSKIPEVQGTWVTQNTLHMPTFRAITILNNQVLFKFSFSNPDTNYLAQILAILAKYRQNAEVLNHSKQSIELLLNAEVNHELLSDLASIAPFTSQGDKALIAIVGNNITVDHQQELFASIDLNPNLYYISPKGTSLCIVVESDQAVTVAQQLHNQLFEG